MPSHRGSFPPYFSAKKETKRALSGQLVNFLVNGRVWFEIGDRIQWWRSSFCQGRGVPRPKEAGFVTAARFRRTSLKNDGTTTPFPPPLCVLVPLCELPQEASVTFSSGFSAGPECTSPVGSNREPWHGQSHVLSAAFQRTMHPRCVQTGEDKVTIPFSSR